MIHVHVILTIYFLLLVKVITIALIAKQKKNAPFSNYRTYNKYFHITNNVNPFVLEELTGLNSKQSFQQILTTIFEQTYVSQ